MIMTLNKSFIGHLNGFYLSDSHVHFPLFFCTGLNFAFLHIVLFRCHTIHMHPSYYLFQNPFLSHHLGCQQVSFFKIQSILLSNLFHSIIIHLFKTTAKCYPVLCRGQCPQSLVPYSLVDKVLFFSYITLSEILHLLVGLYSLSC